MKVAQTFMMQRRQAQCRTWRNLESFLYPAIIDDTERRQIYISRLLLFMHALFENVGFTTFTALFRTTIINVDGDQQPFYEIVSNRFDFIGAMSHAWNVFFSPDQDKKMDTAKYYDEKLLAIQNWQFRLAVPFRDRLQPIRLTYDPAACRISIEGAQPLTVNPLDFPNKVKTTSEALTFIGNMNNINFAYVGDWTYISSNYSLYKLVTEMMDQYSWKPGNVLVDTDDWETWDYLNSEAEAELVDAERKLKSRARGRNRRRLS